MKNQSNDELIRGSSQGDNGIANKDGELAKKPYSAPVILSQEYLEAVAIACTPDMAGGPGKNVDPNDPFNSCATLGS